MFQTDWFNFVEGFTLALATSLPFALVAGLIAWWVAEDDKKQTGLLVGLGVLFLMMLIAAMIAGGENL